MPTEGEKLDGTPPNPPASIYIPGLREIIRLPGQEDRQYWAIRNERLKQHPRATPQDLTTVVNLINYIDDAQDLLYTIAYPTGLALKYFAPRLLPYLGPVTLALDAADFVTGILAIPLTGRLPKKRAAEALVLSLTKNDLRHIGEHFKPTLRGLFGYAIQAAQASHTVTGYGLSLGGLMATVSDTVWAAIKTLWTGQLPELDLPPARDPVGRAARNLIGFIQNLHLFDYLDREEKKTAIVTAAWSLEQIAERAAQRVEDLIRRSLPPNTHAILPPTIYSMWHVMYDQQRARYPLQSPTIYHPPEHLNLNNLPQRAIKYTPKILDYLAQNPDQIQENHLWFAATYLTAWDAALKINELLPKQSQPKFTRWTLRTIETGWYPPMWAKIGYKLFYDPRWPPRYHQPERAIWDGNPLRLQAVPPTIHRGQTFEPNARNLWLWYQRSRELYSTRGTRSIYWGHGNTPSLYPAITYTKARRGYIITTQPSDFALEEIQGMWGPYAPLQAAIELWGQAVHPPYSHELNPFEDPSEFEPLHPLLEWMWFQTPEASIELGLHGNPIQRTLWSWYDDNPPYTEPQLVREKLPPEVDPMYFYQNP